MANELRFIDNLRWIDEIQALKRHWGEDLLLLAHHYQRPEVVGLADRVGDSYELARFAAAAERARFIVFCGVRFMAEAADILRRPEQRVLHPVPESGCPMADMAITEDVERAWEALKRAMGGAPEDLPLPLVYMNSSADLKAWVGHQGGSVCTSSNAERAFQWSLSRRARLFFLPDEHLGRNTARRLGIPEEQLVIWDPTLADGGIVPEALVHARVVLWKGYCHVHTFFTLDAVWKAREKFPRARVLVHPECPAEVVAAADGNGSTATLAKEVAQAPAGSAFVLGTEVNLVSRLAMENPDKIVVPLMRSLCPNMFRISPRRVAEAIRSLPLADFIQVSEEVKTDARLALERMLAL